MRVVILGSGRGSNAEAILCAQEAGQLGRARVVRIIADQPSAGILELGKLHGVPASFIDPAPFRTKLDGAAEEHYITAILTEKADLVVLAGFMRVLKERFLTAFAGRIINLHPSLLPAFPGLDAIGQAWRRGVKVTGCTVHAVTATVDGIEKGDTLDSLERKVHAAEHALLSAVIARLSEHGITAEVRHAD
jgi:phosphoribosylglycinamide formyltransferase 1